MKFKAPHLETTHSRGVIKPSHVVILPKKSTFYMFECKKTFDKQYHNLN